MVFSALDYWAAAGAATLVVIVLFALAIAIVSMVEARNGRALKPHRILWFELDSAKTLHRHERPVQYRGLRRPLVGEAAVISSISLPETKYASLYCSVVMGDPVDLVQLWDRDPEMQMEKFGAMPADPLARLLGVVALNDLAASPEAKRAVIEYLEARALIGEFDTNVDFATGDFVDGKVPPLARGVSIEGDRDDYFGRLDEVPGIFGLMTPTAGAVEAITELAEHFDVYFLSTAPWSNPSAWADKNIAVQKFFPTIGYKRLILSHHKNLNLGDYIIDDRPNNGAAEFQGEWIKYGPAFYQNHPDKESHTWATILDHLIPLAGGEPRLASASTASPAEVR